MQRSAAEERFFQSTRGRVILLLREQSATIEDLAAALAISDNAVRTHIAALERDGLVDRGTPRPTGGKPAYTYRLTPDADRLFPKAYGLILRELLHSLEQRISHDSVVDALRETGTRIAALMPQPSGSLEARVHSAAAVLNDVGGLANVRKERDRFVIEGIACPLADAVEGHHDACLLAQSMLTSLIGIPVAESCIKHGTPRCRFVIAADPGKEDHLPPT